MGLGRSEAVAAIGDSGKHNARLSESRGCALACRRLSPKVSYGFHCESGGGVPRRANTARWRLTRHAAAMWAAAPPPDELFPYRGPMFFFGHPLVSCMCTLQLAWELRWLTSPPCAAASLQELPQQRLPGQYPRASWVRSAVPLPLHGSPGRGDAGDGMGPAVGGFADSVVRAAQGRLAGLERVDAGGLVDADDAEERAPVIPDGWDPASLQEGDLVHWFAPAPGSSGDEEGKEDPKLSWMVGRILSVFGAGDNLTFGVEPLRQRVGSREPSPTRVRLSSGRIAPLGWVPLHDDGPSAPVQQDSPGLSLAEVEGVESRVEEVLRAAAAVRICPPDGTEDGDIHSADSSIGGRVGDDRTVAGGAGSAAPEPSLHTGTETPSASELRKLAHYACVELPDYVDYVVTLALNNEDDRARLTKVLMAATRLIGAYLVDGTGNRLPPRLERTMLTLFLADKPTSYFYDNDGATMGNWKSAAAADGTMMYIPKYGASAFFVPTMNRFGAQGGYEAIMRRFECCDPEPVHLAELSVYLSAMSVSKWCFRPEFSVPYLARMHGALIERLSDPVSEADAAALEAGAALTLGKEFMEWAQVWTRSRAERHDELVKADAVIALGVDVIQELVRLLMDRPSNASVFQAAALLGCAVTGLQEGVTKSRGKPFVGEIKSQRVPLAKWFLDGELLIDLLAQIRHTESLRALGPAVRLASSLWEDGLIEEPESIRAALFAMLDHEDEHMREEAQALITQSFGGDA